MIVELAKIEDLEAIHKIIYDRCLWFQEKNVKGWNINFYPEKYNKDYFKEQMRINQLFVAKSNNKVCGVMLLKDEDRDFWNDNKYLYIGKTDDKLHCYRIPIIQLLSCIKIKYNGNYLSFTTPPTIENDRTLVPMRFLFEQMGADVDWDNATQTAIVKKQGDTISFSINDTEAKVNNTVKTMDVPARLINDKTMIPLRFLSEELGYNVQWDGETRTVTITD